MTFASVTASAVTVIILTTSMYFTSSSSTLLSSRKPPPSLLGRETPGWKYEDVLKIQPWKCSYNGCTENPKTCEDTQNPAAVIFLDSNSFCGCHNWFGGGSVPSYSRLDDTLTLRYECAAVDIPNPYFSNEVKCSDGSTPIPVGKGSWRGFQCATHDPSPPSPPPPPFSPPPDSWLPVGTHCYTDVCPTCYPSCAKCKFGHGQPDLFDSKDYCCSEGDTKCTKM